jgi:hypothetical protein
MPGAQVNVTVVPKMAADRLLGGPGPAQFEPTVTTASFEGALVPKAFAARTRT